MNASDHTVIVLHRRDSTHHVIRAVASSGAGRVEITAPGLLHGNLAAIRAQIDHCLALWGETNPSDKPSED